MLLSVIILLISKNNNNIFFFFPSSLIEKKYSKPLQLPKIASLQGKHNITVSFLRRLNLRFVPKIKEKKKKEGKKGKQQNMMRNVFVDISSFNSKL